MSGVVAEALHIAGAVGTLDIAGSQRAGTSALITACQIARGGDGPVLVTSSRETTDEGRESAGAHHR